ncbi:MAG: nucleotidyltransferase substrate binding protein [Deltaproteobacteria bacterium]|nr:nucleotidyltransferase substrate binding protein [Deltaproteobacteria bacterium]
MLDYSSLVKAISQLEKALNFAKSTDPKNNAELFEQFRNSVIQTFEYSYELCFKLIRRKLMENAPTIDEIASLSFQDVIREGARVGIIDDPEAWFDYRTVRNKTSHAYQEPFAIEAFNMAQKFLPDAKKILAHLKTN